MILQLLYVRIWRVQPELSVSMAEMSEENCRNMQSSGKRLSVYSLCIHPSLAADQLDGWTDGWMDEWRMNGGWRMEDGG